MHQINPLNESFIHAPRYGGRIIRTIMGGTVKAGGGFDPERPRRLDFYTLPCVWVGGQ